MARFGFFAVSIALNTAAALLVGVAAPAHAADASAGARRPSKPVRRTASAPSNADGANQPARSAPGDDVQPASTNHGAASGALGTTEERQKDRAAGRRQRDSGARARTRRSDDPSSGGRDDAAREGAQTKGAEPGAVPRVSLPEGARAPQGAFGASPSASGRTGETRGSAAKGLAEAPSAVKSTAEKFAADSVSEVGDSSRAATEGATSGARRDPPVSTAVVSGRPASVNLEGPYFDGGDVPRAAAALDRMKPSFVKCASIENALTKNEGTLEVRFLVRAPGRAEGVDVEKAKGLSADVVRCMTSVLARSHVGAPSDDPVGVAITVRVRRPEAVTNP